MMNVNGSQATSWLLMSSLLLAMSCGLGSRRVKIGEQFTLRPSERVVVKGTDLEIQVNMVGHQTSPNPQPKGFRGLLRDDGHGRRSASLPYQR